MTYNVFIQDYEEYFLLALNERLLSKVIDAHDKGAGSVSIPGEKVVYLNNFKQIRIFTNAGDRSARELEGKMYQLVGGFYSDAWDVRFLEQFGEDVTRDKIQYGYGESPKPGGQATLVSSTTGQGLWDLLHPTLMQVSQKAYMTGNFKEAALNALIAVDERVGKSMKNSTAANAKKTGTDMMFAAFSEKVPVIKLFPDEDPDAVTMQEGYKYIFAGVMLAIRNPKGHRNFTIEEKDAIELLFIASRLLRKLDEAMKPEGE